jgi:hypothetical protein
MAGPLLCLLRISWYAPIVFLFVYILFYFVPFFCLFRDLTRKESEEWCHPPNVQIKKRIKDWRGDVYHSMLCEYDIILLSSPVWVLYLFLCFMALLLLLLLLLLLSLFLLFFPFSLSRSLKIASSHLSVGGLTHPPVPGLRLKGGTRSHSTAYGNSESMIPIIFASLHRTFRSRARLAGPRHVATTTTL